MIHSGTSIEARGNLFIMRETESLTFDIPIEEYFSTMEALQDSAESLLQTNILSQETDFTLKTPGITLTILTGTRNPGKLSAFCKKADLSILQVSMALKIDWQDNLPDLITGSTISITDQAMVCRMDDTPYLDKKCFEYMKLITSRTQRTFFQTFEQFKQSMTPFGNNIMYIKMNKTHLYMDESNTGRAACTGDLPQLGRADSLQTAMDANFYYSLGKLIYNRLTNLEFEMFRIMDTLIDMSASNIQDPTLKINMVDFKDMKTRIKMLLPSFLSKCKNEPIFNIKPKGILANFNSIISQIDDDKFYKEILKALDGTSKTNLLRLEATKTFIIVQTWFKSTTRRASDLQQSEGAPTTPGFSPWPILWGANIVLQDFECFCYNLLSKPCSERVLLKLYLAISRDKMAARTDLIFALNLDIIITKSSAVGEKSIMERTKIEPIDATKLEISLKIDDKEHDQSNDIAKKYQNDVPSTNDMDEVITLNYNSDQSIETIERTGRNIPVPENENTLATAPSDSIDPRDAWWKIQTEDPNQLMFNDAISNPEDPKINNLIINHLVTKHNDQIIINNIKNPDLHITTLGSTPPYQEYDQTITTLTTPLLTTAASPIQTPTNAATASNLQPNDQNTTTTTRTLATITQSPTTSLQTSQSTDQLTMIHITPIPNTTPPTTQTTPKSTNTDIDIDDPTTVTHISFNTSSTPRPQMQTATPHTNTPIVTTSSMSTNAQTPSTDIQVSSTTNHLNIQYNTPLPNPSTHAAQITKDPMITTSKTTTHKSTTRKIKPKTTTTRIQSTTSHNTVATPTPNTGQHHPVIRILDTPESNDDIFALSTDQSSRTSTQSLRQKRGFVSHWLSSISGLAEQDDIDIIKGFENGLLDREKSLEEALGKLSSRDANLTSDLKQMSMNLKNSLKTESIINDKITEILSKQVTGEQEVNRIIAILDKGIKKSNKMTAILSELQLLENTMNKFKKWLNNILNNKMDIFDVDIRELLHHFGSSGIESLRFTTAEINWEDNNFKIKYNLRRLSEPYKIFNLKSMIMGTDRVNTDKGITLYIEKNVAVASTGEYIWGSDFNSKCTKRGHNTYCDNKDILIHINGSRECELNLIHLWLTSDTKLYDTCYDRIVIRPTPSQDYIIKESSVIIMSKEPDVGRWTCTGGQRATAKSITIEKGLTKIDNINKCGIQTSFLSIPGGFETHITMSTAMLDDLDLDKAMIQLNDYMSTKMKKPFNIKELIEKLNDTEKDLITEHVSIDQLQKTIDKIEDLKELPKMNLDFLKPINLDSHKTVTMAVSGVVMIIITIILVTCCCACYHNSMAFCCAPFKCLFACCGYIGDSMKYINEKRKNRAIKRNLRNIDNEFDTSSRLDATQVTMLDNLSVSYTPTKKIKNPNWIITWEDNEYFLTTRIGNKIYKYDPTTQCCFSGRERNETIPNPSKASIRDLEKLKLRRIEQNIGVMDSSSAPLYPETNLSE